jgi:FtsH-binding integral membrane protein
MYAKYRPRGELLTYEAPLMGGLMGLVGLGVVNLGSVAIFGPNVVSTALHSVDTYGGILLFTGLTAYDTQKAISRYQNRDPDHLGCSVELYLDFMNLFVRIMEIIAKSKNNS